MFTRFLMVAIFALSQTKLAGAQSTTPNTYRLFVGYEQGTMVGVFDIQNGRVVAMNSIPMGGKAYGISINNGVVRIACADNNDQGDVDAFDVLSLQRLGSTKIANVAEKGSPFGIAITKNGKRMFVTDKIDHVVYDCNLVDGTTSIIPVKLGRWAEWAIKFCLLSADENFLFVTGSQEGGLLYRINLLTGETDTIQGMSGARGMAIIGDNLYVTNETPYAPGVTVVDIPSFKVVKVIKLNPQFGGAFTLDINEDKSLVYTLQGFGFPLALNAQSGELVAQGELDSSTYYYGITCFGDWVAVASQAPRGARPNSVKIFSRDLNNPEKLILTDVISGYSTGPYLMAVTKLPPPEQQ